MKKHLMILPFLTITTLLAENMEILMEKATNYYYDAKYDLAYEYSMKILEINDKHPYANFYIGDYYGFEGEFDKALRYYDLAIEYHTHKEFELAYYQRALTKLVLNKDLSYCDDIKVLKEVFEVDDTYQYLEEEHNQLFGLCDLSTAKPNLLISTANFLAQVGSCTYSLLFYNEAADKGNSYDLIHYDKSICGH